MKFVKRHIAICTLLVSVFCHWLALNIINGSYTKKELPPKLVVKLQVVKKEEPLPKEEPPPKPKKKEAKKPKPKPVPEQNLVSGLSKTSLSNKDTTFKAAIGNTLLTEDKGQRLSDVDKVEIDRRQEAKIISVPIPEYTTQAEDAELKGQFEVDVYVNEIGTVTEAEPVSKIGFGMDERVIQAALQAKYEPRKNRFGKAIAGWSKLTFVLKLD